MSKLLMIALIALLATGCQSFTHQQAQPSLQATSQEAVSHSRKLAQMRRWQAQGKMKLTLDDGIHSAAFTWQNFKKNYAINFFGPFGYGSSWLRRTSKGVTLEAPDQPIVSANTPEELLLKTTGWHIPVSQLQYWIKGQPAPGEPLKQAQAMDNGAFTRFEQAGWQLTFSRHTQLHDKYLPGRLVASRSGVQVLIVIKSWELI